MVLAVIVLTSASATGSECPQDPVAARERTRAIHAALLEQARPARIWAWSWGLGYTALTVGQGVPAFLADHEGTRADFAVGAASSGIAALMVALMPPEVMADADRLGARLAADGDGGDACEQLRFAETLLDGAAADQAFGSGLSMHLINAAFNLTAGLVLGLGWGRWPSGALTTLSGTLLGEVQILTMPTGLLASPLRGAAPPPVVLVPWTGPGRTGLSVAILF